MAQENALLLISDHLNKIRQLANDVEINEMMQEKDFFALAERMNKLSNSSHICNGLFFNLYMAELHRQQEIETKMVTKEHLDGSQRTS
jgi:hypothetical protein